MMLYNKLLPSSIICVPSGSWVILKKVWYLKFANRRAETGVSLPTTKYGDWMLPTVFSIFPLSKWSLSTVLWLSYSSRSQHEHCRRATTWYGRGYSPGRATEIFFQVCQTKTKEQTLKEISALVFLKHPHIVPLSAFVLDAASIRRVLSSACSSPSLPVVISKRMLIPSPQMAKSYVGFTTLSVHFSTYRIVVKHTRISKRQTSLCSMTVKLDLWWKNCWEYQLGSWLFWTGRLTRGS